MVGAKTWTVVAACSLAASLLVATPAQGLQFTSDGKPKADSKLGVNSADPDDDIDFAEMIQNGEALRGDVEPQEDQLKKMMDAMGQMSPDMMMGGGMDGMDGMGGMGGRPGMEPPVRYKAVKSDVKHILCDTCNALVKRMAHRTDEFRKQGK
jgi:hypothetical protein